MPLTGAPVGGKVADGNRTIRRCGYIDLDRVEQLARGIEDLDADVAAIRNINAILQIDRDGMQIVELTGSGSGLAPGSNPVAVLVVFGDSRIDVAITDVNVVAGIPGRIRDLPE